MTRDEAIAALERAKAKAAKVLPMPADAVAEPPNATFIAWWKMILGYDPRSLCNPPGARRRRRRPDKLARRHRAMIRQLKRIEET